MFGSNFRGFVSQDAALQDKSSLHGSEEQDSGDSGHCSEAEEEQSTNRATRSEFQLTQSLLSKVKAGENNKYANSGKQAQLDLKRMNFVINGKTIDKECVLRSYDKNNHLIPNGNEDYRTFAKQVFTEMFKHVEAEVPSDNILAELITNCNQAGYECTMYEQIQPILAQYNLTPQIPERTISIRCDSADSVSVEYSEVMHVLNFDNPEEKICESNNLLKFTLKSQDGKVEYKDGKVTLTIPEQLKDYKAGSKSLLGDINRHFEDADNAVVESLIANIDEGPKSFVAEDSSSIIIEGNDTSAQALDNTGEEVTDPGLIVGAISGLVGVAELVVDMTKEVLFPQDQNNIKPSCDDEEFSIIENDTLDKVVNILNKAINGNDYKELDKVISGDKNSTFIIDRSEKFEDFCSQQLKLTAQTDHHKRVRDEICNKENGKCVYSIKKLSLLAIAANDMLVEKYFKKDKDDILFRQDEDLDRLLIGAGGQGYIKALLEFLEEKQSRALPWNNICQKLKRASFVGNQECVKAILKKFGGAELKSEVGVSSKLLHYAIEQGENDVADVLLSCEELDIHSIDDRGYTPLHSAIISKSDSERIRLVLNKGVNVDIKCRRAGKTALHWAALRGCLEKVKLFVEKGADWNIVDSDGKTALDLASKNDKSEVVGFLKDLDGKTPLYYAVLKNRPDVVEKLVLEGADINGIVRYGTERLKVGYPCVKHTPVTRAILDHQLELVKRLLTSKADVNTGILGCYGVYYLFLAVEESKKFKGGVQWEIVNLILEHAPDISTPELKKAVSTQDYAEVVRLLQGIKSNRHDSNLVNGTAASSQAVDGKDNSQLSSQKSKGTDSKQPQENIVDRRENIMNNGKGSTEELISNSFEEGKMGSKPLAVFVQRKISEIISKGNDNLEEEFKDILRNNSYNSVLKYVKSQESPFKDRVVAFLTLQKNKKNGAQINGKQSTNPSNGSVTEQPVQPAPPKNASLYVSNTEDVTNSEDIPVVNGASSKSDPEDGYSSDCSDASYASTIKAAGDFEDEQPNSSPLLPQSSVSGDEHSGSSPSFINVPTSGEGDTDNSEVSSEDITKEDPTLKGSSSLQDIQPEISVSSPSASPNVDDVPTIEEHMVITADIEDSSGRLAGEGDQQNSQPPLPSFDLSSLQRFVDEYSEASSTVSENPLIMDVTNEEEPLPSTAEPDFTLKSSNNPQSTKSSKLLTVVTWTLAVAGVLAGVAAPVAYFAFGASLLVAGITAGVGACCLVAAAIIYYCTPKSQVENSGVEKPFNTGKVPTAVHV